MPFKSMRPDVNAWTSIVYKLETLVCWVVYGISVDLLAGIQSMKMKSGGCNEVRFEISWGLKKCRL